MDEECRDREMFRQGRTRKKRRMSCQPSRLLTSEQLFSFKHLVGERGSIYEGGMLKEAMLTYHILPFSVITLLK